MVALVRWNHKKFVDITGCNVCFSDFEWVIRRSLSYRINPVLVLAIIWQESSWNHKAIGDFGRSYGIYQINTTFHPFFVNWHDQTDYVLGFLKNVCIPAGNDPYYTYAAYNGGSNQAKNRLLTDLCKQNCNNFIVKYKKLSSLREISYI